MKFTIHTIDTAPEAAKGDLRMAGKSMGFVPNLLGVLAEAPIALRAYLELTDLLGKSSLTPIEQQVMMIAGSVSNGCGYCVAAHSTVGTMVKMPATVLEALRKGTVVPDSKLEALRSFTSELLNKRGHVSDQRIQEFLEAGYTRQNVLEVVFAIAMKTLSNYTNHLADTPLDTAFSAQMWEEQR